MLCLIERVTIFKYFQCRFIKSFLPVIMLIYFIFHSAKVLFICFIHPHNQPNECQSIFSIVLISWTRSFSLLIIYQKIYCILKKLSVDRTGHDSGPFFHQQFFQEN